MIILIYNKEDYERSHAYVDWVITEAANIHEDIKLYFYEELLLTLEGKDFFINGHRITSKDCILNRSRDPKLSQYLSSTDAKLYNSAQIALLGNDKMAAYAVARQYFKVPQTSMAYQERSLEAVSIVKSIDGYGGNQVKSDQKVIGNSEVYQERLDNYLGDLRVYIVANKIYASMLRIPKGDKLVSNFTHGNAFEEYELTFTQEGMIKDFLRDYPMDYAGIDFFVLPNHDLVFNEIEDVVGSRMLSTFGNRFNIVRAFMEYIKKQKNAK